MNIQTLSDAAILCPPQPAPIRNNRYNRMWEAIEHGIEENVFIIVAKNQAAENGVDASLASIVQLQEKALDMAAKKIRALESAARILARSEKARAGSLSNIDAKAEEADLYIPGSEQIPAPSDNPNSNGKALEKNAPNSAEVHSELAPPSMDPQETNFPIEWGKVREEQGQKCDSKPETLQRCKASIPYSSAPGRRPTTSCAGDVTDPSANHRILSVVRNCNQSNHIRRSYLADLFIPEHPLPEDPREISELQAMARLFLGSRFDVIKQNGLHSSSKMEQWKQTLNLHSGAKMKHGK